jgi:hypothetical protein
LAQCHECERSQRKNEKKKFCAQVNRACCMFRGGNSLQTEPSGDHGKKPAFRAFGEISQRCAYAKFLGPKHNSHCVAFRPQNTFCAPLFSVIVSNACLACGRPGFPQRGGTVQ